MASSLNPEPRRRLLAVLVGPLQTIAWAATLEMLTRFVFDEPIQFSYNAIPLLLIILYATFRGGVVSGLISNVIALGYLAYYLSEPGQLFVYSPDSYRRLWLLIIALPIVILFVGRLKLQAEQTTRLEAEREAAVSHAERLQAANEELTMLNEELQSQQEELEVQQQELEQVTEEFRASNERLASETSRMKAVLGSSFDGILMMDDQGRIIEFNRAAERLFGYSRDEAIGKELAETVIPPRLREAHRRGLARYLATGEGPILGKEVEMPAMRSDGTEFPVALAITRVPGVDPPLFTGYIRDITERKMAAEQHQHIEVLEQTNAYKDQFISILSHELRTPINAITGFGSILDDEVAGPLTEQQHQYLRKMLSGAEALLSLVNDLLDMSRIQAGQFSLSCAPMNLSATTRDVVAQLTPLADQKHQKLVNEVPQDLSELVADEQRVGQILVNLVNNAIKFTPDGGTIWVRAHAEGDRIRLEIQDTGIGIAPEDIPKLFQRFTQLDMSSTRKAGGTGLGLSISKALVEAHGGSIGAQSPGPGRGSTFWFSLPLAPTGGCSGY